jgi:hypothetical protein
LEARLTHNQKVAGSSPASATKFKTMGNQNKKDNLGLLNIVDRMCENTPPFWKKVRKAGIVLGVVGAAILSIGATGGIALPVWLASAGTVITTVGATAVTVAQTASCDR